MDKEALRAYFRTLGLTEVGFASALFDRELYQVLQAVRTADAPSHFEEQDLLRRCDPKTVLPGAKSVVVCLFPYYRRKAVPKNLSRYASLPDYHRVAGTLLQTAAERLSQDGIRCVAGCDASPLVERWLAFRAGLGFWGKNHLLINPRYGSYVFIGTLVTDANYLPDRPLMQKCMECGACIRACPGGALTENGFCARQCISEITQRKQLETDQEELLRKQKSVWGCDVCQDVCPHNRELPETPIESFRREWQEEVLYSEIAELSNRAFRKKYQLYPFTWRGRQTLLKNFRKKS